LGHGGRLTTRVRSFVAEDVVEVLDGKQKDFARGLLFEWEEEFRRDQTAKPYRFQGDKGAQSSARAARPRTFAHARGAAHETPEAMHERKLLRNHKRVVDMLEVWWR
jgi:hypothetical protein